MTPASQTGPVSNEQLLDAVRELQTISREVHKQIASALDDLTERVGSLESSRR